MILCSLCSVHTISHESLKHELPHRGQSLCRFENLLRFSLGPDYTQTLQTNRGDGKIPMLSSNFAGWSYSTGRRCLILFKIDFEILRRDRIIGIALLHRYDVNNAPCHPLPHHRFIKQAVLISWTTCSEHMWTPLFLKGNNALLNST